MRRRKHPRLGPRLVEGGDYRSEEEDAHDHEGSDLEAVEVVGLGLSLGEVVDQGGYEHRQGSRGGRRPKGVADLAGGLQQAGRYTPVLQGRALMTVALLIGLNMAVPMVIGSMRKGTIHQLMLGASSPITRNPTAMVAMAAGRKSRDPCLS